MPKNHIFVCVLLLMQSVHPADLVVTELMAINDQTLADDAGEFDDWVELYNTTDSAVDLADLFLSNDPDDPTLWQIPSAPDGQTIIAAKSRVVIWLDNDPEQGPLHAPFRLSGEGGRFLLTDRDGTSVLEDITLPPQHPDIAFGRPELGSEEFIYLINPTPSLANNPIGVSQLEGVVYSRPAGIFTEPFELTLSTQTDGGSVKFTTDGKEPGLFAGQTFTEAFTISESSSLRAAVFVGSKRVSPVTTQIYLAVDAGMLDFSSDLPVVLIDSQGHDFSRDTSLSTSFPPSLVSSAFLETGEANGRTTMTTTPHYLGRAGMNVRGASSREWPKQQYKFEPWGENDEDRPVPLLGMPADADWILAAPYFDRSLMRNHLTFRWWEKLGYYSPRTRFFELFLDMDGDHRITMDDYQGVYVLTEKIKRSADRLDIAELKSSDDGLETFTGSYAIEATNVNQHWNSARGIRLKYVEPRESEPLAEAKTWIRDHYNRVETAVLSDDFGDLDMPSHIDYDIMRELSRNIDGASTFLSLNGEGKVQMGPLWDYNQSFGLTSLFAPNHGWKTDGWNVEYMTEGSHWMKWWMPLGNDPDYQTSWNDRWVELREELFTNEALLGDIANTATLLDESQQRNFQRWDILGKAIWITGGGTRADPGESDRDTFAKEVAFVREWLTSRLAWIDSQVPAPPAFSQNGGALSSESLLELSAGEGFKPFGGTIYFTLDGSDPREPGGTLNASATPYDTFLSLTQDASISTRSRSIFGKWSSLRRATFLIDAVPANADNLTISEIHYNPEGADDLEFIELANRGDRSINLTNVRLTGAVDFTFGTISLKPGAVILIVEDQAAFGIDDLPIAGQWQGGLRNSGETLNVLDSNGADILTFSYDDGAGWPESADGQGRSLERLDLRDNALNEPTSWRASDINGGTPGSAPTTMPSLTFTQWQTLVFENQPFSFSNATADPDHDGYVNLLEFAFASDPLNPTDQPAINIQRTDVNGDGFLEIRYPTATDREVTILIETSTDLLKWTEASFSPTSVTATTVSALSAEAIADDVGFVRLKGALTD